MRCSRWRVPIRRRAADDSPPEILCLPHVPRHPQFPQAPRPEGFGTKRCARVRAPAKTLAFEKNPPASGFDRGSPATADRFGSDARKNALGPVILERVL